MLKEVGASGQISLGKRFAGQLFEVTFHSDGRVEMLPMQAVPVRRVGVVGDRLTLAASSKTVRRQSSCRLFWQPHAQALMRRPCRASMSIATPTHGARTRCSSMCKVTWCAPPRGGAFRCFRRRMGCL